ncbi:MAG: hypothetical protein GQ574_20830 [Crocinitomix sp.]|nr:hypothetical protein [Crocinitomix sp.]
MRKILALVGALVTFISFSQSEHVAFSDSGDNVLWIAGVGSNSPGLKFISINVFNKSKPDKPDLNSRWFRQIKNEYSLDSIPNDTISKYHLNQRGLEFDLASESDFKISFEVVETSKGEKIKGKKKTKIKTAKGNVVAMYKGIVLANLKDFKIDFVSVDNSAIEFIKHVKIECWKHPSLDIFFGCIAFYDLIDSNGKIQMIQQRLHIFYS